MEVDRNREWQEQGTPKSEDPKAEGRKKPEIRLRRESLRGTRCVLPTGPYSAFEFGLRIWTPSNRFGASLEHGAACLALSHAPGVAHTAARFYASFLRRADSRHAASGCWLSPTRTALPVASPSSVRGRRAGGIAGKTSRRLGAAAQSLSLRPAGRQVDLGDLPINVRCIRTDLRRSPAHGTAPTKSW